MNCAKCNSEHIIKKGKIESKTGIKQRYFCLECNHNEYIKVDELDTSKQELNEIDIDLIEVSKRLAARNQYLMDDSRSSSLCGGNPYSEKGLNLSSRASQNIFIVHGNKEIDAIKIDLQNTNDINEYYDIDTEMIEYETKSVDKLNSQNKEVIMTIVI